MIQSALDLIEEQSGKRLDLHKINYQDKKVFELLSSGKTEGVFQLESSGMKSFMKELKPESLEDVIAGISLYRPGPMDFIPQYIKGKNDRHSIQYACPQLEKILAPTYGCIVYQEQVMQIVMELAGYTMGRSDLVRRAMSKKKGDVMERERQNFVYGNEEEGVLGCIHNGIAEDTAHKIFDDMIDFAKYAFNKSHAAAYAVVSYQTAYLKCYYPIEFMAALLTSVLGNPTKVAGYIIECRQMGIAILPPDVNEGNSGFSVSNGRILYGLSAIKSLGKPVIEAVIQERKAKGKFKSLKDFVERLSNKEVNKRTIESFIKSGAFDSLHATRKQMMLSYSSIIDSFHQEKKQSITGQITFFDFMGEEEKQAYEVTYPDVGEYDKQELLALEKDVLGVYISGHPLEDYMDSIQKNITATTTDFIMDGEEIETRVKDEHIYVIGGLITNKTVKITKYNQNMAFLTIEDLYGTVEVIVFPREYTRYQNILEIDAKVYIRGRASISEEEGKLICDTIIPFEQVPKEVWIQFQNKQQFIEQAPSLYRMFEQYKGETPIVIYCKEEKAINRLPKNLMISASEEILVNLSEKYGKDNIKVVEKSIENLRKIH